MALIITLLLCVVILQFAVIMVLVSEREDHSGKLTFLSSNSDMKVGKGVSEVSAKMSTGVGREVGTGVGKDSRRSSDILVDMEASAVVAVEGRASMGNLTGAAARTVYEGAAVTTFLGAPKVSTFTSPSILLLTCF